MGQCLDDHVEVVVLLDVVHAHEAWRVFFPGEGPALAWFAIQLQRLLLCVFRIGDILNVFQSLTLDLVAFGEHVDLLRFEIDVDVVVLVKGVEVGV